MSGTSWTSAFGNSPIVPSQPSYEALTIAANTDLVWPTETAGGDPYVAQQIDVTASQASLQLRMPVASSGSKGAIALISNVGTLDFTLTDQSNTAIVTIAPTETWLITLTDNATDNGTWRSYQIASTTTSANAAALAGDGLQASGGRLRTVFNTRFTSADGMIDAGDRAYAVIWQGAAGTLTLDTIANLEDGWYCAVKNDGSDVLTLQTSGGATIDGGGTSVLIHPGDSGLLLCDSTGFNTIGGLIDILPITGGGTGATSAPQALVNLGGSAIGTSIFTAPNASAIIALLGLNHVSFTEGSVSTDQVLSSASANTIFVCTAALALTLPLTTLLTNQFVILVDAKGGAVVLTPQASDAINGGAAAATVTVPQGGYALLCTDAGGNWYTLYGPNYTAGNLTAAGNLAVTGTSTFTGAATFNANATFNGGTTTIAGNLVGTTATYSGAVTVNANLAATGAVHFSSTMQVDSNVTMGGVLTVAGDVVFNGAGNAVYAPNGLILGNVIQSFGAQPSTESGWVYNSTGGGPSVAALTNFGVIAAGASMLAVSFFASSDGRLKFDIEDISEETAKRWVMASRPVTYRKRPFFGSPDKDATYEAGFIAQEQVRAGFGEFVTPAPSVGMPVLDEDDYYLAADHMLTLPLNYQVAMLCVAVQSLLDEKPGLFRRLYRWLFG